VRAELQAAREQAKQRETELAALKDVKAKRDALMARTLQEFLGGIELQHFEQSIRQQLTDNVLDLALEMMEDAAFLMEELGRIGMGAGEIMRMETELKQLNQAVQGEVDAAKDAAIVDKAARKVCRFIRFVGDKGKFEGAGGNAIAMGFNMDRKRQIEGNVLGLSEMLDGIGLGAFLEPIKTDSLLHTLAAGKDGVDIDGLAAMAQLGGEQKATLEKQLKHIGMNRVQLEQLVATLEEHDL
jgi:hypothetical protein